MRPPNKAREPVPRRQNQRFVSQEQVGRLIETINFDNAPQWSREFSDDQIDQICSLEPGLFRPEDNVYKYLIEAPTPESDIELMDDPARIAELYKTTVEMMLRNIQTLVAVYGSQADDDRCQRVLRSQKRFVSQTKETLAEVSDDLAAWCLGGSDFPSEAIQHFGFNVDGTDILDFDQPALDDVRTNFRVQRPQLSGDIFIHGHTQARLQEKMTGQDKPLSRRIYLNPNLESVPIIFEELLRGADDADIPLSIKMNQTAPNLAINKQNQLNRGLDYPAKMRADNIVIAIAEDNADETLRLVYETFLRHQEEFADRPVPLIPMKLAGGLAIGDEPQAKGASLNGNRSQIIYDAAAKASASGHTSEITTPERRSLFRSLLKKAWSDNDVNADNPAFNNRIAA